jgi:hypothetical protein
MIFKPKKVKVLPPYRVVYELKPYTKDEVIENLPGELAAEWLRYGWVAEVK